jgi:hypothetical protein
MKDRNGNTDWKQLVQDLLVENDKEKIKTKAFELENALFARGQELPINGKAGGERQEMRDASRKLLQVKIEKLGFPIDPKFLGGSDRSVDPQ